jgi:hypothetical protein
VASGGGARGFSISRVAAEATVDGNSNKSIQVAATTGNEKTLRVSAYIYNPTSGTTTAERISAGR